jgi:hypothetical protein
MKSLKLGFVVFASTGLLFLGACSNGNQAAESGDGSTAPTSETTAKTETPASGGNTGYSHEGKSKGGQVVESGKYHLEFVPEKGTSGTHMDLYLQKGDNHEAIPNAKVTADIQLPDGKQKTFPLTYDASGKHYTAAFTEKAAGQYQVKITADISGEKVNGRFSFNQ